MPISGDWRSQVRSLSWPTRNAATSARLIELLSPRPSRDARAPPLVAELAGHTVEVLLRIYAHCLDGDDERWFSAWKAR